MTSLAIDVRDLHKVYRRYGRRKNFGTLKSALLGGRVAADLRPDATFEALDGVSFQVQAGRTVGIIGRNGSGKSTLLKLLAGIGRATSGTVDVTGRVSALIELGAGFHPEISGRENIYINGMMMGLSKRQVAERFDAIVAFAEIGDFIEAPVKTYSSGMYMRLGFSVAIHVDPDVLLVDEVLAVGDQAFTHKCLDRFAELRRRGKTIVLVTHTLDLVTRLCDEVLWLDRGTLRAQGDPKRVVDAYLLDVAAAEDRAAGAAVRPAPDAEPAQDMTKAAEGRWGSREAEVTRVELRHASGAPGHVFQSGEVVDVVMTVQASRPLTDFVFGVAVYSADGVCCYGTNTHIEGAAPQELSGIGEVVFRFDALDLVEGAYRLDVAVHRADGVPYDYHRLLYAFRVTSSVKDVGFFRPKHGWSFSGGIRIVGPGADRSGEP
jgi:ABC-type polysaccharide/polyol phosphate transport system ATPase subunit